MKINIVETGSTLMLSRIADILVPTVGRLSVTTDPGAELAPGSIIAANHTSLADPAIVVAALRSLGAEPVVMAAAGLWRVPLLGRALAREGHIPVFRGDQRAADALDLAAGALEQGRLVLIYAEGACPVARTLRKRHPAPSTAAWPGSPSAPAPPSYPWARPVPAESPRAAPSSSSPAWSQRLCAGRTCTCTWARRWS